MRPHTTAILTTVAMLAFAANSILCRFALRTTAIDPAAFTATRIGAAALFLWLVARAPVTERSGSWLSAMALFAYAATFSFAYVELPMGVGALLLFGAVQVTMIGWGYWKGERLDVLQWVGMIVAAVGLAGLLLPAGGTEPFSLGSAGMMLVAGAAWGMYSLRGRSSRNPSAATRENFLLAVPFAAVVLAASMPLSIDANGFALAAASGAITSGAAYMIWYAVVPRLTATQAASVQLCVPVIAALFGLLLLGETLTPAQLLAAIAVLAGVGLTMRR